MGGWINKSTLRGLAEIGILGPAGSAWLSIEGGNAIEDGAINLATSVAPVGRVGNVVVDMVDDIHDATMAGRKVDGAGIGNVVQVPAGSKGNWDKAVNGQLESRTTYALDNGHRYTTDAGGRVNKIEADLSLTKMDRNGYQQCATG